MLPSILDLSTLRFLMWIIIVIAIVIAVLVVKSVEAPMLRVFVAGFLAIICLSSYFYQKGLTECKTQDKSCTFFSYVVPNSGGIING